MYIKTTEHTFPVIVAYLLAKGCKWWYGPRIYHADMPVIYVDRFNRICLRMGNGNTSLTQLFQKKLPPTMKVGNYLLSINQDKILVHTGYTFRRGEVVSALKALRSNSSFRRYTGSARYDSYTRKKGVQVGCTYVSREKLEKIYSLMKGDNVID